MATDVCCESLPELSDEQLSKLQKLENEMIAKNERTEKNAERNKRTSLRTGIPLSVVDTDVVQMGIFLGLFNDRSYIENDARSSTEQQRPKNLITSIFNAATGAAVSGKATTTRDDRVPAHFTRHASAANDSAETHRRLVSDRCDAFSQFVAKRIGEHLTTLRDVVAIGYDESIAGNATNVEEFRRCVADARESLMICARELATRDDDDDDDHDDCARLGTVSIPNQLRALRRVALATLPIGEYLRALKSEWTASSSSSDDAKGVAIPLLYDDVDRILLLQPGFARARPDDSQLLAVHQACVIDRYVRDPSLHRFDATVFARRVCTPALIFFDVRHVVEISLTGPYNHESICYVDYDNYYLLDDVMPAKDGRYVRVWVRDASARRFATDLGYALRRYCARTLRRLLCSAAAATDVVSDESAVATVVDETDVAASRTPCCSRLAASLLWLERDEGAEWRAFVAKHLALTTQLLPCVNDYFNEIVTTIDAHQRHTTSADTRATRRSEWILRGVPAQSARESAILDKIAAAAAQ